MPGMIFNGAANSNFGDNFITNSGGKGFVMSNGAIAALANQGSQLIASWSNADYDTFTSGGADITSAIWSTAGTQDASTAAITVVSGKVYKILATLTLNSGAAPTLTFTNAVGLASFPLANGANTVMLEASSTSTVLTVTNTAAANWSCTFTLYEVEPSIVAASALAMDNWDKTNHATGVVLTRKFNGGLLDTIELNSGADSSTVNWSDRGKAALPVFYSQFAGQDVVLGAKITCSAASKARIGITDSAGTTWSSYHTGGGTEEFLQVSRTPASNITSFNITIDGGASTVTSFRHPILVYGTVLQSSSYRPIPNETVLFEDGTISDNVFGTGVAKSTEAATQMSLEASSYGRVPKGIKGIFVTLSSRDSGSAAGTGYIRIGPSTAFSYVLSKQFDGSPNSTFLATSGLVTTNLNGDIAYQIAATGAGTTQGILRYYGVQF